MSTQQKYTGIPYETALANLRAKTPELNGTLPEYRLLPSPYCYRQHAIYLP